MYWQLKRRLGIAVGEADLATTQIGPDRFAMPVASPLLLEHERLTTLLDEVAVSKNYHNPDLIDLDPTARGPILLAATERHISALFNHTLDYEDAKFWQSLYAIGSIAGTIASSPVQLNRDGVFDFVLYLSTRPKRYRTSDDDDKSLEALLAAIERETGDGAKFSEGERYVLHLYRGARIVSPPLGAVTPEVERLTQCIGDQAPFYLVPGECWSDAVNTDLAALPAAKRAHWIALLKHLLTATTARPSEQWKKLATERVKAVGERGIRSAQFAELSAARRDELLTALERDNPTFFNRVRLVTLEGMFGDPFYGGNRAFAGWDLIRYPGPRMAVSADDQRLREPTKPLRTSAANRGGGKLHGHLVEARGRGGDWARGDSSSRECSGQSKAPTPSSLCGCRRLSDKFEDFWEAQAAA